MKTLIALDVDCVLLPWDDESYKAVRNPKLTTYDRYGKITGFKDWKKVAYNHVSFYSPDQIKLIQEVGEIHWLTTWLRSHTINELEKTYGIGPFPQIRPIQHDTREADYLFRWWKMGWFYLWVRENHEYIAAYDRVLWVDDDHYQGTDDGIEDLEYDLAKLGTELHLVRPEPVWTRKEIEEWHEKLPT